MGTKNETSRQPLPFLTGETGALIDGKATAAAIKAEIAEEVKRIVAAGGKRPHLAAILVGHDGGSETYVKNKVRACEECGFQSTLIRFEEDITEEELLSCVSRLNRDNDIDGFIVQLPLPRHIDEQKVIEAIDPIKDVDCFHPMNVGYLTQGMPRFAPCTPAGIVKLMEHYDIDPRGKHCVVIGRSNIVGKPMAQLLLKESMNVTVLHSKTLDDDKRFYLANADLIVVATGHMHTLTADYLLKPNVIVFDVGINVKEDGKLTGDCDKDLPVLFQSPVPGGCGLLTRLSVIDNLIELSK